MSAAVLDAPPPPAPRKRYTPDDLLALPDQGAGYELVDGELVEQTVSALAHVTAARFAKHLGNHVDPAPLGWVFGEGSSFRCFADDPDRVRRADGAVALIDRYPLARVNREGFVTVCPDLVVEIVSPHDIADEVNAKRLEWLEAGVRLVWVVYPVQKEVHAYTSPDDSRVFRGTAVLTAEPVLPGFGVPLPDLFPSVPGPQ